MTPLRTGTTSNVVPGCRCSSRSSAAGMVTCPLLLTVVVRMRLG